MSSEERRINANGPTEDDLSWMSQAKGVSYATKARALKHQASKLALTKEREQQEKQLNEQNQFYAKLCRVVE